MSRRIVSLLVAAMSLALSGCFISDQPKFSLGAAAPAFAEGGRYEVLERVKDGSYRHQESFVVRHLGNGGYEFVNEKGEILPISFHALAGGLFVGQAEPRDKDRPGYGYVVFKMSGAEAFLYAPQCDEQDNARLAAFKVEHRDRYNCVIDHVDNALELFSTLKLGEPVSRMVRQ